MNNIWHGITHKRLICHKTEPTIQLGSVLGNIRSHNKRIQQIGTKRVKY